MDPELIRLAQEQITRMSPADLARIQQQMMANPQLIKIASESIKNMTSQDVRQVQECLKDSHTEDMMEFSRKIASTSPEELARIRSHVDSETAIINSAHMLKNEGNSFHSKGQYADATKKYLQAKKHLKETTSSNGQSLALMCSLNLMSCYLKTGEYNNCIDEGTEVLAKDGKNLKALYRRGQAFKQQGMLREAIEDLSKAREISPDDETVTVTLRDAEEKLALESSKNAPIVEEVTEEISGLNNDLNDSASEYSVTQPHERDTTYAKKNGCDDVPLRSSPESFHASNIDRETTRGFENFISSSNSESLAAINGGLGGNMPPEMIKTASSMISKMPPEELQRILQMASSCQLDKPYTENLHSNLSSDISGRRNSIPANLTPDMVKSAADMMSKMSTEELSKMFEIASSLKENPSVPEETSSKSSYLVSNREDFTVSESNFSSDISSASGVSAHFPGSMDDPALRQAFASMVKNLSPETMASMSGQFGVKLSREDAAKAQQAISSLTPENLDRMLRWLDRAQRGVQSLRTAKNWLLGTPGIIMAICMLLIAFLLHWLGYING